MVRPDLHRGFECTADLPDLNRAAGMIYLGSGMTGPVGDCHLVLHVLGLDLHGLSSLVMVLAFFVFFFSGYVLQTYNLLGIYMSVWSRP